MLTNVREITIENLHNEVMMKKREGFRFSTMTCCDLGETYDILYHFDKDYVFHNLRLALKKGEKLPSISHLFFAAVLIENEIIDMFGIEFTDIIIDYKGRFLISDGAPTTPLNKNVNMAVELKVLSQNTVEGAK